MATGRMFNTDEMESDGFLDLSLKAQLLYFHISLNADDDGFTKRSGLAKRLVGATDMELKELDEAGFIHVFASNVVLILDWHVNNILKKDRYHPTKCTDEYAQIDYMNGEWYVLNSNATSKWHDNNDFSAVDPERNQDGTTLETEVSKEPKESKQLKEPKESKKDNLSKKSTLSLDPERNQSYPQGKGYEKLDQMSNEQIKTLLLKNSNSISDMYDWLEKESNLNRKFFSKDFNDRVAKMFQDNFFENKKKQKEA